MNADGEGAFAGTAMLNALVVAADLHRAEAARAVLAQADIRLIDVVTGVDSGERLGDDGPLDLVVIEGAGISDDALDAMLPRIDATDLPVVAVIDPAQIDLAWGHLAGPHVQLLCSPTEIDRALAIMLARPGRATTVGDSSREAERLRQLNEEVARIAEALARLTRQPAASSSDAFVADRRPVYRAADLSADAAIDAKQVRAAIRTRRLRDQFFPAGLLEDPAWDMLLDLFAAHLEGARVSVSSLCIAAAVPPTTALRWIAKMSEAGLLERVPDANDRRRAFIALSDGARRGMADYCTAATRQGLQIG